MKEAPPPSVLGDVDDAVTPEADGELTPWSSPRQDEEEVTPEATGARATPQSRRSR